MQLYEKMCLNAGLINHRRTSSRGVVILWILFRDHDKRLLSSSGRAANRIRRSLRRDADAIIRKFILFLRLRWDTELASWDNQGGERVAGRGKLQDSSRGRNSLMRANRRPLDYAIGDLIAREETTKVTFTVLIHNWHSREIYSVT